MLTNTAELLVGYRALGGTVDWGHLKAGDRQYGDAQQYDLVGDEVLAMLPPPPPPGMAAAHSVHMQQSAEPPGTILASHLAAPVLLCPLQMRACVRERLP